MTLRDPRGENGDGRGTVAGLKFDYDLLVIGSGPAGQRAAIQGAKLDKKVAVIEKTAVLGGVYRLTDGRHRLRLDRLTAPKAT